MVKMANLKIFYCLLFCIVKLATAFYCWVDYNEDIPPCAISTNGIVIAQAPYAFSLPMPLYSSAKREVRANYYGILPGSFDSSKKAVVTEKGGKKLSFKNAIKFLCDKDDSRFSWERVTSDSLTGDGLKNLVVGGYELDSTLYIGKVFLQGEWQVSKVFPASSQYKGYRGWYPISGEAYQTDDFEILKYV
nr:allo A subunit alpha [Trypoxylus dichotomus]